MTRLRILVLIVGPIPIVLGSFGLSRLLKPSVAPRAEPNHVVAHHDRLLPMMAEGHPQTSQRLELESNVPSDLPRFEVADSLRLACDHQADVWREQLGDDCHVVVRAPFVLAGDLTDESLITWHRNTIEPASRAMACSYFPKRPDAPISVLLFSGERSYEHYAKTLFADTGVSIYGYYKRGQRVLVMNIATGGGTLVHELTHALADFDCPRIPDWLNEGLASLHEQCRFRPDGSGIEGLENWRLPKLQEAIRAERLRSLASLVGDDDFREHDLGLNYAQARYFCMYLDRRGLLQDFFRRWRKTQRDDALAVQAVRDTFADQDWDELDRAYREWVLTLTWPRTPVEQPAE